MAAKESSPGPFFLDIEKKPLSKPRFIREQREALVEAGVNQSSLAVHSFQIGAATAASQAGLPDSNTRTYYRWNRTAFHTYIRTPRSQISSLTSNFT